MKHRQNIFVILRTSVYPNMSPTTILDSFYSLQSAEERAGAYAQMMLEKNIHGLVFTVLPSTYYDQ